VQLRFDILNLTEQPAQSNWGIGQSLISSQPLTNPGIDAAGRATYRLRVVDNAPVSQSYERSPGTSDLWRMQVSVRSTFN
jgi:hypothetical protein